MRSLILTHWHSNDRRLTRNKQSHSERAMTFCVCVAASGLSCIMQDPSLWCTDSLVMACRLSGSIACGILVPQPGIEPASPALQSRFFGSPQQWLLWRTYKAVVERGWVGERVRQQDCLGKIAFLQPASAVTHECRRNSHATPRERTFQSEGRAGAEEGSGREKAWTPVTGENSWG